MFAAAPWQRYLQGYLDLVFWLQLTDKKTIAKIHLEAVFSGVFQCPQKTARMYPMWLLYGTGPKIRKKLEIYLAEPKNLYS